MTPTEEALKYVAKVADDETPSNKNSHDNAAVLTVRIARHRELLDRLHAGEDSTDEAGA